jgi:hypothetical protein
MKVVMLSDLCTSHLYPPGNIPGTHFCWRLSRAQGHSAARRIMSMKNSSDTIGNRACDLPACSALPQPTAPPNTVGKLVSFGQLSDETARTPAKEATLHENCHLNNIQGVMLRPSASCFGYLVRWVDGPIFVTRHLGW